MELKGKTALITGGARVGRAVIEALAARGCDVVITYRGSKDSAEKTAEKARALGAEAWTVRCDVTKTADLEKLAKTVETIGRLNVFVHMASPYLEVDPKTLEKRKNGNLAVDEQWRESLDSEARAGFWLSLRLAGLMRKSGGGRVINFSDWLPASERVRYLQYPTYYVAKAAVKASTEYLALALAPDILVNAIAPGPIQGPDKLTKAEIKKVEEATPLKRWGGASEIAKAVLYLIDSDFTTGETIRVDGGRHLL